MELTVTFKPGVNQDEYQYLHPKLRPMIEWLALSLSAMDCDLQITSMLRKPNAILGESNVHATGRAIDLVPRARKTKTNAIHSSDMQKLADTMCIIWRRNDQKRSALWHSMNGGGLHFHLQVQATKDYADLKGEIPKRETMA